MRPVRFAAACACVVSAVLLARTVAYATPAVAAVLSPEPGFAALSDSVGASAAGRTGSYASASMSVELTLAPRDQAGLASALRSAYTTGSTGYHKWLGRGQFDARYAPSGSERAAVAAYLQSAGLTVTGSSSPFLVRATGSSQQVESAFRTSLGSYQDADGARYFANSTAVWLPVGIASDVLGVIGLTNTIHTRSMLTGPQVSPWPEGKPASVSCDSGYPTATQLFSDMASGEPIYPLVGYGAGPGCSGLTPSQVNSIYGAPQAGSRTEGAGVTVGLFELSAYQPSDISTWAQQFYGPGYHPRLVNIDVDGGPLNPACPAGDQCPADYNGYSGDVEVDGDIEMDLTIAPDARQIEVYNAPGDTTGETYLDEYAAIANQDTADVVSASWATCENDLSAGYVQAENELFEQMALQGQSMFSGSGDSGPFGCLDSDGTGVQNVTDPSAQPWVTGTGGTSLESDNPGTNPEPGPPPPGTETVWNPGHLCSTQAPGPGNDEQGGQFWCGILGAGGGGFSQYWGRPFYQSGPGVTNPAYPNASGSLNSSGIAECVLASPGAPCREDPDVSADADPFTGIAVYCTGTASLPYSACATFGDGQPVPGWFGANGTSLSGPLWAAIIADRDSYHGERSGNINPWVYLQLRTDPGKYFNDVTGNGPLQQAATSNGMFPVTPGYDMATGAGTPKMAALITGP